MDLTINDPTTTTFNKLTIIGCIISDKVNNFKDVKAILTNVWGNDNKTQISYLDKNRFACIFEKVANKDKVVAASQWSICGHIIIIKE